MFDSGWKTWTIKSIRFVEWLNLSEIYRLSTKWIFQYFNNLLKDDTLKHVIDYQAKYSTLLSLIIELLRVYSDWILFLKSRMSRLRTLAAYERLIINQFGTTFSDPRHEQRSFFRNSWLTFRDQATRLLLQNKWHLKMLLIHTNWTLFSSRYLNIVRINTLTFGCK